MDTAGVATALRADGAARFAARLDDECGLGSLDAIESAPGELKRNDGRGHVEAGKWACLNGLAGLERRPASHKVRESHRTGFTPVRWQIEELHRGLKQLCGTEKCQCRKQRSQRNHLALCYHAYLSLKVKAESLGQTLYQLRSGLFREYLCAELRHPRIPALQTT